MMGYVLNDKSNLQFAVHALFSWANHWGFQMTFLKYFYKWYSPAEGE